jgi:hypothetical protein
MKKTILLFAVLAALLLKSNSASAQIQKGNILIGGDIGNLNLSLDNGGAYNILINPKVAWFIKTGIAVGGYANLGLSGAKDAGTSVNYGIGALGRYYITNANAQIIPHSMFFVEGNVGIEGDNPATGDNTNGLGLGIGPGWTYFVNPNIGLEVLLKYNGIVGFGSSPTSNNLNLLVGFQIYLGYSDTNKAKKDAERK